MKILKTFFLSALTLLSVSVLAQDATLKRAWEKFNANDRKEAEKLFTQAMSDPATKAQASLGLSFVMTANEKPDKAFDAFMQFFNSCSDPYPYTYGLWTSGCVFSDYSKKTPAQLKFLEKITADPKANGTMKSIAWGMLGGHYRDINKLDEANKCYANVGALENWQAVGPFENISASGFDKDWNVLAHAEPTATFKNKVEAEVKWFNILQLRNDKWLDFEYHFDTHNSIIYAQTFVTAMEAKDAFLMSGNSGSMKIWVNDKLITSIVEERNCDLDVYGNPVKLNKGVNRILVQIGESEAGNSNFLVRITDNNSNPIGGITSSQKYQQYEKGGSYTSDPIPFWAEKFFEEKIKAEPDNILNYFVLAETYLRNDKSYEAKKILQQARKLAPSSSYVSQLLIQVYNRDKNETDYTQEQESIKSNDSTNIYAMKLRINDESEKENYDGEEKILEQMEAMYGKDLYTELKRLDLLSSRKQIDEMLKMEDVLYKKYPDNFELMSIKYQLTLQQGKDLSAGNRILDDFCKYKFDEKVYTQLAENYFKLGNKKEALKILLDRVKKFPYAIGYVSIMADIYFKLEEYDEALTWARKTLEYAPYIGAYWQTVGEDYEALKNKAEAKKAYQKAVYFQPTNYDARQKLRLLDGKPEVFESFAKEDVYELFKKSPAAKTFPEDNSMVLLNDVQRVMYPEGGTEQRVEFLVKIFNKSGIDRWKEYSIGYNSYLQRLIIEKAEVLKSNGSKVQAEKKNNQVVFTKLEEGDAIHISYRLEDYSSGKLAHHFWDEHNFNIFYPVGISRYSLLAPTDMRLSYICRPAVCQPEIKEMEGFKLYTWKSQNLSAIKTEQYMPPLDDIGQVLEVSSLPDWNFVAQWYSDLSSTKAKPDFEVKEAVNELFHGKTGLTEYQKGKMIYEYIEENIRYSNVSFLHSALVPQKASRTLSTHLGDCKDVSTLFVAMCKEVGIKANLVLIDTRDGGEIDFTLPCISFNHCIASASLDGKQYIVELTDNYLSFTSVPFNLLKGISLNIPRDGDTTSSVMKPLANANHPSNCIVREATVSVESNDIIVKRSTTRIGRYASSTRNDFGDIGKLEAEKEMSQRVGGDFTNPVKLTDLNFGDLKSLRDTVSYNYTFRVSNEVKDIIGLKIMKLPWADSYSSLDFVSLDERKYPYNVWRNDACESQVEVLTLNIPAGKALAEKPQSIKYSCAAYDYSLNYQILPTKVIATRSMKLKKDQLPIDEYSEFKEFCKKVAEADGRQIGFK